jgi:uncharacterized membrane protein
VPQIGSLHPQIVHFVIALLFVGVAFRLLSLTGKAKFTGPAATTLILLGTLAAFAAVKSGDDAHGPAERIPGANAAVHEHEEWGERARNVFFAVALLELVALGLALSRYKKYKTYALVGSGVIGLAGLFAVYEAAEHGGELVYSYAGGVGTRSGEADDIERLLIAGLYHQSVQDRAEGRAEAAAALVEEMARRLPDDESVALLAIESLIADRADGRAALEALSQVSVPGDNRRLVFRHGMLTADAYMALALPDSARITLEGLKEDFPTSATLIRRLEELGAR